MIRIATRLGMTAALTVGLHASATAQTTRPTKSVPVTKEATVTMRDTVYLTVRDTIRNTVYRRDTVRLTGPTVMRHDTVTVTQVPGWLDRTDGVYFGVGAGSYFPSAG